MGKSFAMMETVLILATMIGKFQVLAAQDHFSTPRAHATLRPGNGVRVLVKKIGKISS